MSLMKFPSLLLSVSGLFLVTAALHAGELFNPQGKWLIRFDDSCSGTSTYSNPVSGRTQSIQGGDFVCSSYLSQKKSPQRDEIEVQYSPDTQEVKLTGGPSAFPRTIQLDKDKVGVSNVRLFPKSTKEGPGCDLYSYDLESVKFTNSNRMLYGYVTVHEFMPRKKNGCDHYLSELKVAIQRRTATSLLLAMRDVNAVNVEQMKNLSAMNVFQNFMGTRVTPG
ncbi:MAG: hypothetical protein ACJ763_10185 [Bdellovibrionia bacterium]